MTSFTIAGRTRDLRPEVDRAAQTGVLVACIAARHVSIPSPTISTSAAGAKRTAPPLIGPSEARSRRRQIPRASTIAGVPSWRRSAGAYRSIGGGGDAAEGQITLHRRLARVAGRVPYSASDLDPLTIRA